MRLARIAAGVAALLSLAFGAASMAQPYPGAHRPASPKLEQVEAFRHLPGDAQATVIELAAPEASAIEKLRELNTRSGLKRLEIGFGRDLGARDAAPAWTATKGGHVAHWKVTSREAKALRVALQPGKLAKGTEVRFAGVGSATVYGPVPVPELHSMGPVYWSPVLEGETALIEVFVPEGVPFAEARIAIPKVSHLFVSPSDPKAEQLAKVSGACEVDVVCRTPSDAALAQISRSVARMTFTGSSGGTGLCTGTLLNPQDNSFTPYFYSAAHCFSSQSTASTLTTHWNYENTTCGVSSLSSSYTQVGGGSTLLHANTSTDILFVRLARTPPSNAWFSGWDAATLSGTVPLTAVHHPAGDVKKVSLGSFGGHGPATGLGPTGSFIRVNWNGLSTGVTEPGSSGGGIWSRGSSEYVFRGGLLGGPSSCTQSQSNLYDYYSRFDQVYSTLAQYLNPGTTLPEGPNILANPGFEEGRTGWVEQSSGNFVIITNNAANARAGSWFALMGGNTRLNESLTQTFTVPSTQPRLSFWYRITTEESSSADYDTLQVQLLNAAGSVLATLASYSNRAATSGWVQTSNFDLASYAGQSVRLRFLVSTDSSLTTNFSIDDVSIRGAQSSAASNYTALWWNPSESGWGVNVTQQGDILFATLFTYDSSGAPLWLVASDLRRQGSTDTFTGALYRTTGPAFNTTPFVGVSVTQVGTMTFTFSGASSGTLSYTNNGVQVTKSIQKQVYGSRAANCTTTTGSRASSTNYQDLWWNASESGWGLNITHQDNTLFGTLFTYGSNNQVVWLVMSNGVRQSDGSYFGELYRTAGPVFNASPWTGVSVQAVGTMRLRFSNGETGTLEYTFNGVSVTKSITRQVFSSPVPLCS